MPFTSELKKLRPALLFVWRFFFAFFKGLFAGFVSVFLPRMMLSLSVHSQSASGNYVELFHPDFLWLGAGFAVVIGIISLIFEASEKRSPKEAFMAALGIPALLSGVLNTTSATNKLQKAEQDKSIVIKALSDQTGIVELSVGAFTVLGNPAVSTKSELDRVERNARLSLFPTAYAESTDKVPQNDQQFDPGIRVDRPNYLVLLKRAANREDAIKSAKAIQSVVPTAQAIQTVQGYFVIDSASPRSKSNALFDAIQLKSKLKSDKTLDPSLLQVPLVSGSN